MVGFYKNKFLGSGGLTASLGRVVRLYRVCSGFFERAASDVWTQGVLTWSGTWPGEDPPFFVVRGFGARWFGVFVRGRLVVVWLILPRCQLG